MLSNGAILEIRLDSLANRSTDVIYIRNSKEYKISSNQWYIEQYHYVKKAIICD